MTQHRGTAPYWIDTHDPDIGFPDVELALHEPDGLLAIGGDLSIERLLLAYRKGIFPWYGPEQPILWWAPNPRLTLHPDRLRISRSLAKTLKKGKFAVTVDKDFHAVITDCAEPRPGQSGTWITPEMMTAYYNLHNAGHAHSVECWHKGALAGGLYGVSIGRVFFGESMFTRIPDASKVALVILAQQLERWNFALIDCQVYTEHLESLGASPMERKAFTRILDHACRLSPPALPWAFDDDLCRS